MIPSRPLDLGGIIGESIRIIRRTYWRSGLLLFIFWVTGLFVMQLGINDIIDAGQEMVEKFSVVSPNAPILLRDYLFTEGEHSFSSMYYLRFQYPDLFNAIDSIKYSVKAKYPDSTSRQVLKSRIDSISAIVRKLNPIENDDLDIGIIIVLFGGIILTLGIIANVSAQYDLSTRAYENRALDFAPIFRFAISRSLWLILFQYVLIGFAMLFGLGIVIGITYAISPVLGTFGFLASVVAFVYAQIRILFSRVALVSEELNPFEAIKRSLELTKGLFWRIFGIGLLCGLLIFTTSQFLHLPFSYAISPNIDWLTQYIRGNIIDIAKTFQDIHFMSYRWLSLFLISSIVSASLLPAFLTTFYYDLRTRKDGALEYPSESETESGELSNDSV